MSDRFAETPTDAVRDNAEIQQDHADEDSHVRGLLDRLQSRLYEAVIQAGVEQYVGSQRASKPEEAHASEPRKPSQPAKRL